MAFQIREPDQQIRWEFGVAPNPLNWVWLPVIDREVPDGWRGYWGFTWLFVHLARGWRYV